MMKDQEKINMEINIGGEPIELTVPFQDQELTRNVEEEINKLFAAWRRSFPKRSEKGLLAMMVYRYASYYKELTIKYQDATRKAEECLGSLDDMLNNFPNSSPS